MTASMSPITHLNSQHLGLPDGIIKLEWGFAIATTIKNLGTSQRLSPHATTTTTTSLCLGASTTPQPQGQFGREKIEITGMVGSSEQLMLGPIKSRTDNEPQTPDPCPAGLASLMFRWIQLKTMYPCFKHNIV